MESTLISFLFAIDIACACGFLVMGIVFAKDEKEG